MVIIDIYRRWKLTYSIKLSFVMMPIQTSQVNSQYISEYTERNYYPSNIVFGHLKWNLQMGKIYHDQFRIISLFYPTVCELLCCRLYKKERYTENCY